MKPSISYEGLDLLAPELLEKLSIPDVEYLAERSTAVNTKP
jgi:hypothetical protein